jgi:type VI secretion system protein ImpJ
MIKNKVAWLEGMFLLPQHFQQQERYYEYLVGHALHSFVGYCWGFTHLTLDRASLQLGRLAIENCAGYFADGSPFVLPGQGELPQALTAQQIDGCQMVYLAIPRERADIATMGSENTELRYKIQSIDSSDMVEDSQQQAKIEVACVNTRLITEKYPLDNYECLPIAKIKETNQQSIILDEQFIPPVLNIQASAGTKRVLMELFELIGHCKSILQQRVSNDKQLSSLIWIDVQLLQLINKYHLQINQLVLEERAHPKKLHQIILLLLAELSTYLFDTEHEVMNIAYQHDQLQHAFIPLLSKVNQYFQQVFNDQAVNVKLASLAHGLWQAETVSKALLESAEFILEVSIENDIENFSKQFIAQSKVASIAQMPVIVSHALRGVSLVPIAQLPRQLPAKKSHCYFKLDQSSEAWEEVRQAKNIAIQVGNSFPGIKIQLWAIKRHQKCIN